VKSIKLATRKDKVLVTVLQLLKQGWPEKLTLEHEFLQPFHNKRNELSQVQDVLTWGVRVVIPTSLRSTILKDLHSCHLGIVRKKSIARQYVWWPNIDKDIKQLGESCETCCQQRLDPAKAPLYPWRFPDDPWTRLHVDLAGPFST